MLGGTGRDRLDANDTGRIAGLKSPHADFADCGPGAGDLLSTAGRRDRFRRCEAVQLSRVLNCCTFRRDDPRMRRGQGP